MLSLDHSLNSLALHQLGRGMDINQEHTMQGTTPVFAPALSFCLAPLVPRMVKICLQCGRPGLHPWVGKISGEGNGNSLQYSCLENPWTEEEGVTKSQT